MWDWIQHAIGTDNLSGPLYGFWSGFGSDLGEVAIFGGVVQLYRKHNCHAKGCFRIGRHQVEGTPYIVCAKHHPGIPDGGATYEQIKEHHRRATAARDATTPA